MPKLLVREEKTRDCFYKINSSRTDYLAIGGVFCFIRTINCSHENITKKLNQSLILRMLSISSAKIRIQSLSSKNQGFLSKFNYLGKSDF